MNCLVDCLGLRGAAAAAVVEVAEGTGPGAWLLAVSAVRFGCICVCGGCWGGGGCCLSHMPLRARAHCRQYW